MSLLEELFPLLYLEKIKGKVEGLQVSFFRNRFEPMSAAVSCRQPPEDLDSCRDEKAALVLKFVAIASILLAGIIGVAAPLAGGKKRRLLRTDSNLFFAAKAFAAGVILATGFVHMLPDATAALSSPCLPPNPWSKFPFSGFVSMVAALATLVVDFMSTQYYEGKQERRTERRRVEADPDLAAAAGDGGDGVGGGGVFGEEEGGGIHIVGIHAHAAQHRHTHSNANAEHSDGHVDLHSRPHDDDEGGSLRHVVVSQVLELGIVSHSVIIGLSLGVSESPCTIRPLLAALSFHQFFEGFALGGCISQAGFGTLRSTVMACFFAVTAPIGVGVGAGVSSFYDPDGPRALIVEGVLDSISAGILVYMALVDLIAADFMSTRMKCNVRLQVVSYISLFVGAGLMASLAIWA